MMRKDISAKFLAVMLSFSMSAGMCVPAVTAYAAEENGVVQDERAEMVLDTEDGVLEEEAGAEEDALEKAAGVEEHAGEEALSQEITEEVSREVLENEQIAAEETAVNEAQASAVEAGQYVLMNIPYDDFYKAEINDENISNTVAVDAFTSATKNKTRTGSLAAGSYHVKEDGSDITGVIYPVKIGEGVDLSGYKEVKDTDKLEITVTNRGQTTTTSYNGSEALFENPSYSYYVFAQDVVPAHYKTVTTENGKLIFGKAEGTRTSVQAADVKIDFKTESSYGDYQMKILSAASADGKEAAPEFLEKSDKIYGVTLETAEGTGYGLRHMENIWRKYDLSWCTGFTSAVHNCPTDSEHYKSMMGKTIHKVVYYTDTGIYEIPVDQYVPVKFECALEAAYAPVEAGITTISFGELPKGYQAAGSVENLGGVSVDFEKKSFVYDAAKAKNGRYTLKIEDESGVYASISTVFELYVDAPVKYNAVEKKLKAKAGVQEADFNNYLTSIQSVEVDGKAYAASGRGAVEIIKIADGTLVTTADPIKETGSHNMKVLATGYAPLEFVYSTTDIVLTGLDKAIQDAGKLKASDYTSQSWAKLQTALTAAQSVQTDASTQAEVDTAVSNLNTAVKALVKAAPARPKTGAVMKAGTINYQVKNSTEVTVKAPASKSVTKVSIPAAVVINGYTYKVTAVADKAFSGCSKLKTVSIGKNVATIGTNAFSSCKAITKVNITSTVLTKIGNSAFQGCTAMTGFTAQSVKLASIGKKAFYGDKKLKTVTLKTQKLTKAKVGANAFKNIKATCTFKVPAKKVNSYKKIFQAKGAGKKIKVKK